MGVFLNVDLKSLPAKILDYENATVDIWWRRLSV